MFEIPMPLVWLAIAIILGVIEAVTVTLISIWFAIGALAAIIPAYFGVPLWGQILVFLAVSVIGQHIEKAVINQQLVRMGNIELSGSALYLCAEVIKRIGKILKADLVAVADGFIDCRNIFNSRLVCRFGAVDNAALCVDFLGLLDAA